MKNLILVFTVASATTLFADLTTWVNAKPNDVSPNYVWSGEDGSVVTNTTAATAVWEIDADPAKVSASDATLFTPASAGTFNTLTKFKINTSFDAMYDMAEDASDAPVTPPSGSLGAIIVGGLKTDSEFTSTNYYAYVITNNSAYGWARLYGVEPGVLTNNVDVGIDFLYLNGVNEMRYTIGSTVLTNAAGTSLFAFTPGDTKQVTAVQFVGSGKVASIGADVRSTEYFDGGDGTEATPYVIGSAEAFMELAGTTAKYSSYFKQSVGLSVAAFAGLGTSSAPFTGTYDGDGKAIAVASLTENGFFNYVKGATLKNVELTVAGGSALALVGTATADAAADAAVTIVACTNKTSAIESGSAFIATVAQGEAVSGGELEANAKYTSIGSVESTADESGFNFATVSDSTASYVADDEITIGTNYKVMFANSLEVILKPSGTTVFDCSLAAYNGTVAVESTDVNTLTTTPDAEKQTITYVTAVKPASAGVFTIEDSGTGGSTGNIKVTQGFVTTLCNKTMNDDNKEAIQTALNANGKNGIPEWQNYALGLSTKDALATADKKPMAVAKQTTDTDKITLSLGGINPPSDSGATVTYKVSDSTGEVTEYGEDLEINLSTMGSSKVKYITIDVIVNQANAQAK